MWCRHGAQLTTSRSTRSRSSCIRWRRTDRADTEAILRAVRSDEMPAVPMKRIEKQDLVAVHRVREQRVTIRTARISVLRGHLRKHCALLRAGAAVPAMWRRRRRRRLHICATCSGAGTNFRAAPSTVPPVKGEEQMVHTISRERPWPLRDAPSTATPCPQNVPCNTSQRRDFRSLQRQHESA